MIWVWVWLIGTALLMPFASRHFYYQHGPGDPGFDDLEVKVMVSLLGLLTAALWPLAAPMAVSYWVSFKLWPKK